jgi:GNAT superfamily N-acetyltransferase
MVELDIETISTVYCPPWTTPQALREKWQGYFQEQQQGIRTAGILRRGQELLGYGSLLLKSKYPHFADIPEIHDVWIYEGHRKQGLGRRLVGWLEALARQKGYKEIGIGVGLYADYGAAERLYAKLGYVPDGHGVTYNYQPTTAGVSYPLDDELVLWLKKKLVPNETHTLLGIDNVFFNVKELSEATTFYEKLGFKVKLSIPRMSAVLFSIGQEEPGLLICQKAEVSPSKLWVEVHNANLIRETCDRNTIPGIMIETATGYTYEVVDNSGNIIGFADYTKKPELARSQDGNR